MVCFSPLKAYRASGGAIVFDSKKGFADLRLELPCGQCIGCRIARAESWALRCVHESTLWKRNSFITLTYDNDHVPKDGSLNVKHWQDFAKRLRKKLGSFRFFHCGEYGDVNNRPHYHACIFGQDFSGDRFLLRDTKFGRLYRSEVLEETWGQGFCTVGGLSYESARYVARYVIKKASGSLSLERYQRYDPLTGECWSVRPEYVTMSRRPGIGRGWYEKYKKEVFPSDEVVYNGRSHRVPRYYGGILELEDPEAYEEIRFSRRASLERGKGDLTPERLADREKFAKSMDSFKRRDL